ncbi:MAG TPA: NAD(P)/FAD-dependent oxidoreductase [Acidimicrobiales bacterium]|nr:NAD(P)/FAD-dependent oxidoreductase [Acidimicrobiales bacterium]
MPDAVVIGAGPNGLVAANHLADAGWSVVVLEAAPEPGGAVRTGELTIPGFRHDLFSAFYPLAKASPAIRDLNLEEHGLRWCHAPLALAHPLRDGRCAAISLDVDVTADSVGRFAAGDGDAWRAMVAGWEKVSEPLVTALMSSFPPVRPAARLAARLGPAGTLRLVRHALLPVRRMTEELFDGIGAGLLLGGSALHTDLSPEAAASGFYGWLLACLGQQVGFPVPEGGAGALTAAMVARLRSKGGDVVCNSRVEKVVIRGGRAVAVRLSGGDTVDAGRAVLADVNAPILYCDLIGEEHLPPGVLHDLEHFQWDTSTVKVDWALSRPVPWSAPEAAEAGTVHVADDFNNFTEFSAHLAMGLLPSRPFLLFGQQSRADPTRSPEGTETAWAYTHVPRHLLGDAAGEIDLSGGHDEARWLDRFVERIEERVEALAPGFRSTILGRHAFAPVSMEATNANLNLGAINGGTSQLHQQLIFRPIPGAGRPETPVAGLYLASSSAHPGGGVHGAAGANAARAALLPFARTRSALIGRGRSKSTG